MRSIGLICVNREFVKLRAGVTSPVTEWLRSLAHSLHAELGGPGVGALGMCLTGGFALAMMVDESVAAPVVAQPSLPAAFGAVRKADLGLSPTDLATVRRRVAEGCPVLGVRYRGDPATGTRFETLATELGAAFIQVELEGKGHATLTAHRGSRSRSTGSSPSSTNSYGRRSLGLARQTAGSTHDQRSDSPTPRASPSSRRSTRTSSSSR